MNQLRVVRSVLYTASHYNDVIMGTMASQHTSDCLLNRLFRHTSKKTSKLRVTGLCAGNSPVTDEFLAQMASNAENVSIWWRHHEQTGSSSIQLMAWYLFGANLLFIHYLLFTQKMNYGHLDHWEHTLIARFVGPTWGPSGADRTQVGPMLAPWTLLSEYLNKILISKRYAKYSLKSIVF